VRDLYFQERQRLDTRKRRISPEQRVILSKFALLLVALSAAFVAARRSSDILPMVSASFSLAGSALCRPWCWASSGAAPRAVVRWPACCWAWP
jgi:cation/acetate symporter